MFMQDYVKAVHDYLKKLSGRANIKMPKIFFIDSDFEASMYPADPAHARIQRQIGAIHAWLAGLPAVPLHSLRPIEVCTAPRFSQPVTWHAPWQWPRTALCKHVRACELSSVGASCVCVRARTTCGCE